LTKYFKNGRIKNGFQQRLLDKRRILCIMKQPAANSQQPTANSQQHRLLWIDFAKTIGIWLVVFGHIKIPENFTNVIYSFHMPLFFFISGYLERDRTIKETFRNGLKTIIIPYVILYGLFYLWWFPVSLVRHPEIFGKISLDSAIIKPFLGMIFGVGYNTIFSTMIDVPLWFLIGLFFVKIFFCFLRTIFKQNIILILLTNFVIIAIVYRIKTMEIDLLFSLDSAFLALPYFVVGNIMKKHKMIRGYKINGIKNIILVLGIFIICFMILILTVPLNGRIDINEFNFGMNILLFYPIGMIGIISTIILSQIYQKRIKIIEFISNGTIIIMAFHGIVSSIILRVIGLRGEEIIINPFIAGLVAIIGVIIFVIPTIFIKKYFPIILGRKK
jgi:fucose 4-O-acetylase-like acetyltransferase